MKTERLKKRAQFVCLNEAGRRYVTPAFVLLGVENGKDTMQVGFTASKKIGNAVCRNRAKRRLRALVDDVIRLNPGFESKGMVLVLIARKDVLTRPYQLLQEDFQKALRKIK